MWCRRCTARRFVARIGWNEVGKEEGMLGFGDGGAVARFDLYDHGLLAEVQLNLEVRFRSRGRTHGSRGGLPGEEGELLV